MAKVQIREYYEQRKGTMNGLPLTYFNVNIASQDFLQPQCEAFIDQFGLPVVANDYNSNPARGSLHTNLVHDLFDEPSTRPLFLVINCVSNSTQQPYLQLLHYEKNVQNFALAAVGWRAAIDSVQAPRPRLTDVQLLTDGAFRFTFPGQRGRNNRVECTTDFLNWTVLTNFIGTNAPSVFEETDATAHPRRFYRVRRL